MQIISISNIDIISIKIKLTSISNAYTGNIFPKYLFIKSIKSRIFVKLNQTFKCFQINDYHFLLYITFKFYFNKKDK